jgi:hypothetical protein
MQTVTLTGGSNTIDLGTLREGDANDDNFIMMIDFSILAATFGVCEGTDGFDERADGGGDGCILITDFSLLASNFGLGKVGRVRRKDLLAKPPPQSWGGLRGGVMWQFSLRPLRHLLSRGMSLMSRFA